MISGSNPGGVILQKDENTWTGNSRDQLQKYVVSQHSLNDLWARSKVEM